MQVSGTLRIVNFNGTLLVRKCSACKGQNLNLLAEGAFCYTCGKRTEVHEVVKLLGQIENAGVCTDVSILGESVDKVLQFDKSLLKLCKEEQGLARILLSEVEIGGAFMLDPHGQIIGFR